MTDLKAPFPYFGGKSRVAQEVWERFGEVREYCKTVGDNPLMRIALCGHDGEHDELLELGWTKIGWKSNGMAKTEEAKARAESETVWFSPHCLDAMQGSLF